MKQVDRINKSQDSFRQIVRQLLFFGSKVAGQHRCGWAFAGPVREPLALPGIVEGDREPFQEGRGIVLEIHSRNPCGRKLENQRPMI